MPDIGRVLRFRSRDPKSVFSAEDSARLAKTFLSTPFHERSRELLDAALSNPDCFLAISADVKARCDSEPLTAFDEAAQLYRWIENGDRSLGLFDERDYFLGECALTAGNAARQLGKREEAESWLDLAEAGFRHTVNPAPLLANVAYARLALHYDRRQYQRVFDLVPSLTMSFRKLGMNRERLKCEFLTAMTLKESSQVDEALAKLQSMRGDEALAGEPGLKVFVLLHCGELFCASGKYEEAVSCLREVSESQSQRPEPLVTAHLKGIMAEAFRQQGLLRQAAEAYHAAAEDYSAAGMATLEAYLRIVLAETLVVLGRHREAEWQIAAALPTIEEQGMVPEGFAAAALLRESIKQRKGDFSALRQLREHLQINR